MSLKLSKTCMWLILGLINLIGLATIYSVTRYASTDIKSSFNKHIMFLAIAIALSVLGSRLPAKFWQVMTPWIYCFTLIMLALVLIIGQTVNGAQSWIRLPGLSIQPSEMLKFTLVLTLAKLMAKPQTNSRLQDLFLVILVSAIPLMLVLKQPDLGTAMTLIPMIMGMCYLAGYNLPNIWMMTLTGSLGFLLLITAAINEWSWIPIHNYQLGRIVRVLYQDNGSPLLMAGEISPNIFLYSGIAVVIVAIWKATAWRKLIWVILIVGHVVPLYAWSSKTTEEQVAINNHFVAPFRKKATIAEPQLLSAKLALAKGSWFGSGYRQGEETQYQRLPYAYSDLVFAAYGEEWGFAGCVFLIFLYTSLTGVLVFMSFNVEDKFASLCIAGMGFMVLAQVCIHVGYTIGLLPMTGITMPFMSAGGTALVSTWMMFSLAHSCASEKDEYML